MAAPLAESRHDGFRHPHARRWAARGRLGYPGHSVDAVDADDTQDGTQNAVLAVD